MSPTSRLPLGILNKLCLWADTVADGQEAVTALENTAYDLVLMDVQMPVMNGFDATRVIRDERSAVLDHEVPIIAMTAYAMPADAAKCLAAGMNGYVSKPIKPHVLAEALGKWLRAEHPDRPKVSNEHQRGLAGGALAVRLPCWDRAALVERLLGDEDLALRIVEAFVGDMPAQVTALGKLLANNDVGGAACQAHAIKGAAANVGAEAMRAEALKMERAATAGDLEVARGHMDDLQRELDRMVEASKTMSSQPEGAC